jgi:hypothetical protein
VEGDPQFRGPTGKQKTNTSSFISCCVCCCRILFISFHFVFSFSRLFLLLLFLLWRFSTAFFFLSKRFIQPLSKKKLKFVFLKAAEPNVFLFFFLYEKKNYFVRISFMDWKYFPIFNFNIFLIYSVFLYF